MRHPYFQEYIDHKKNYCFIHKQICEFSTFSAKQIRMIVFIGSHFVIRDPTHEPLYYIPLPVEYIAEFTHFRVKIVENCLDHIMQISTCLKRTEDGKYVFNKDHVHFENNPGEV